jgi:hypothetical protein
MVVTNLRQTEPVVLDPGLALLWDDNLDLV